MKFHKKEVEGNDVTRPEATYGDIEKRKSSHLVLLQRAY